MKRRSFIHYLGTLGTVSVLMPELLSCDDNESKHKIELRTLGADYKRGHVLREPLTVKQPVKKFKVKQLIVGGGISGLSTAYHLSQEKNTDFLLVEMAKEVGGNSGYSSNENSRFPLGAHYLTLPNPENRPLIEFLKKHGLLIRETAEGKQEYNERHLCFAPDERLLFRGVFHEGLVPTYGINTSVQKEIQRFFKLMDEWQEKKGSDGKFLFSIPLEFSSNDDSLLDLDQITFDEYLNQNNFKSDELRWFLDYCSRDDFGAGSNKISAWAGINYFAGRRANPSNTIPSNVLTWPEGNGYLVNILKKPVEKNIQRNILISSIKEMEDHVLINGLDFTTQSQIEIEAQKCVLCTPSYVNKHILNSSLWTKDFFDNYVHHPWLVCAVVLDKMPKSTGQDLSWDNVSYGTRGLGYIYDQHQHLRITEDKIVISVYLAFDEMGHIEERKRLFELTETEMKELILAELRLMHPGIEQHVLSMTFQRWGHGMVSTYPGSLKKQRLFEETLKSSKRVYLAHTDFAGYSVFEEGFQRGLRAAKFLSSAL